MHRQKQSYAVRKGIFDSELRPGPAADAEGPDAASVTAPTVGVNVAEPRDPGASASPAIRPFEFTVRERDELSVLLQRSGQTGGSGSTIDLLERAVRGYQVRLRRAEASKSPKESLKEIERGLGIAKKLRKHFRKMSQDTRRSFFLTGQTFDEVAASVHFVVRAIKTAKSRTPADGVVSPSVAVFSVLVADICKIWSEATHRRVDLSSKDGSLRHLLGQICEGMPSRPTVAQQRHAVDRYRKSLAGRPLSMPIDHQE
jgi:hypothetical protein